VITSPEASPEADLPEHRRGTALIAYFDTSALLKTYFKEDGSGPRREWLRGDVPLPVAQELPVASSGC
jgi:hypothetical protein